MNLMLNRAIFISAIIVLSSLAGVTVYRKYTGLNRWQSVLLYLVASGSAVGYAIFWDWRMGYYGGPRATMRPVILIILLSLLTYPFIVRLYRKWIGGHLTEAEKLPGMDGVRAWLTPGNLICALLIPLCVWQAFQISLPLMFMLTFGLLLAYPVFNMAAAMPQPAPAGPSEDLSHEREKVLQLLEAGKITADESAELLNALGQSVPARPQAASELGTSPQRKMVLLGAALLLLGFFLPWFAINPGAMMNEMAAQLQQNMGQMMPETGLSQMNLSGATGTVQVHAGDLAHGLGWWILALGIGAAVLPFFATTLKAQMQKKVILAALGVGLFLLVYLLSDALRHVGIGAILALVGYALEVVGTLKERPIAR